MEHKRISVFQSANRFSVYCFLNYEMVTNTYLAKSWLVFNYIRDSRNYPHNSLNCPWTIQPNIGTRSFQKKLDKNLLN